MPSTLSGWYWPQSMTYASRVQQQTYGHRGRRDDPLYGIRCVLRRGAEHLTDNGWARLLADIEAGDDRGQAAAA
jgi:transposase